jgi:hypothetical protein
MKTKNKIKSIVLTLCSLVLSNSAYTTEKENFLELVKNFKAEISSPLFTEVECADKLKSAYRWLYEVTPEGFSAEAMNRDAKEISRLLFETNVALRNKLAEFEKDNTAVRTECLDAIRDGFRAARFASEYALTELAKDVKRPDSTKLNSKLLFSAEENYLLVNPDYKFSGAQDLQSGDAIMTRGSAVTSAAIARIGDIDSQFSHLALIYKDENGKFLTLEAYIEDGAKIRTLEAFLHHGIHRAVVFRHKNRELAAKAAKMMYERFKKEKNIPYDFNMNLADHSELFCSEVIANAYEMASNGSVMIPKYKSTITGKNHDFAKKMDINGTEMFAPGDMQLETQFDVVAEWRDLAWLSMLRQRDMAMTGMYNWIENDYKLHSTSKALLSKNLFWFLRKVPGVGELFADKFPTNMTREFMDTAITLEYIGAKIIDGVTAKDEKFIQQMGRPMTGKELVMAAEEFRLEDLAAYNKYTKENREWLNRCPKPSARGCNGQPRYDGFHSYFRK